MAKNKRINLRSLFSKMFGSDRDTTPPTTATSFKIIGGDNVVWTPYNGDIFQDADVRACVDAIARNGAKMHPRHIRNNEEGIENIRGNTYRLLAKRPNDLENAYQFYYQIIWELKYHNEAYVYVEKDENLKPTALYPLVYEKYERYEYKGKIYIEFTFSNKKKQFIPLDDLIHLTNFASKDGFAGGSIKPLKEVLSFKHILDEGIVNAIKITSAIKGVIKSTQTLLKPEDVKKMRDQFVEDFVNHRDGAGIGGLDASTTFDPVKIEPTTASSDQVNRIDSKVLKQFGLNEKILTSSYSEDEWNAFYESVLEPIGLQMSLEFTNKVFSPYERFHGNEIIFESNFLQYASNNTKVNIIRYCGNVLTINEQREILNLSPKEGGDIFLIDQNHEVNSATENPDGSSNSDNTDTNTDTDTNNDTDNDSANEGDENNE